MISIIIPSYNRSGMIKEAIESIHEQDYKDIEIVVVDDNSSDDTKEVISKLQKNYCDISYYRNEKNMGPGYNRGFGFKKSKGDYVIFMDDDDAYIDNTFFSAAIKEFNQNKNLSVVSSNAYSVNVSLGTKKKGNIGITGEVDGEYFLLNMGGKFNKPLSTFTSVFKKEALERADLEHMKMVNDYAIYQRALLYGNIFILKDKYIGEYRLHANNISNNITEEFIIENLEERKFAKKILDARTKNGKSIKKWWHIQMLKLFKYYSIDSKPHFKNACKVYKWIFRNSPKGILFNSALAILLIGYYPVAKAKEIFRNKTR